MPADAAEAASDSAAGEQLRRTGPVRLWHHFVASDAAVGSDLYRAEWGATGPAVQRATGEAWRYLAAPFVHESAAHLLIVGGAAVVAGALVERRCAAPA